MQIALVPPFTILLGTKGLKGKNDPSSTYLREGNYKKAFDHTFVTGESVPSNVIGNVLNNLLGCRITFYCLRDDSFSTYIVSNLTKRKIIEKMVVPKTKCLAILGRFKREDVIERVKELLLKEERRKVRLPEPERNYVKNEATGRMVCVGSRKYKELFPEAKKHVGRPARREKWDPISVFVEIWNATDGDRWSHNPFSEKVTPSSIVGSWFGRKVTIRLINGDMYVLDPKRYSEYLTAVVRDGFAKHGVAELRITK